MDEAQIKHMVSRFLQWKLPENFSPDCGISFKREFNEHTAHPMKHEPVGTNLFDATQAEAMVLHIVEGLPVEQAGRSSAAQMLSNLLARIHRDGGHYEHQHGTEQAVFDADLLVASLYAETVEEAAAALASQPADAKETGRELAEKVWGVKLEQAVRSSAEPVAANVAAFAKEIIKLSWDGYDGSDDVQECAEKHGLLRRVPFDPQKHKDPNDITEAGDWWYEITEALAHPGAGQPAAVARNDGFDAFRDEAGNPAFDGYTLSPSGDDLRDVKQEDAK